MLIVAAIAVLVLWWGYEVMTEAALTLWQMLTTVADKILA